MKRSVWLLLALVLAGGVYVLLAPLTSMRWSISFDAIRSAEKADFLNVLEPLSSVSQDSTAKRPPNVIILYADDLGKFDVSLYGGTALETPYIDQIGRNGITFSEGYTSAPICAPARAGLLTGRSNNRMGFEFQPQARYPRNRLEWLAFRYFIRTDDWQVAAQFEFPAQEDIQKQGLPPDEITIQEVLQAVGYKTGMFGKWHLGHEPMFQPHHRGFDEFYGFYEAFSLFADSTNPTIVNARVDEFTDKHIWSKGREGTCAIRRNDSIIQEEKYLTFAIADEANAFIHKNKDVPFLLYVPFNAPHTPFQAPESYVNRFLHEPNPTRRVYLAMIAALDDAVGSILATLEKYGLSEHSIIWFASDNGAATYTTACSNEPLKGGKLSNFEGGLNIPYMVQWKGVLPANQWYDLPVSTLDIFPTSLAAIGINLPADRAYDGVNLLPFLTREVSEERVPHAALYWRSAYNKAIRAGRYKLIMDESVKRITLYDLEVDKEERKPLNAEEIIQELLSLYRQWEQQMPAPLWPGIMDYQFEIDGTVYSFRV